MSYLLSQFLLATVERSEEIIDGRLFIVAAMAFVASAVFGLAAFVLSVIPYSIGRQSVRCGIIAIVLSLFPIGLIGGEYRIDYVPVEVDGTKASGPLWQAIGIPCIPLLLGVLAIVFRYGLRLSDRRGTPKD